MSAVYRTVSVPRVISFLRARVEPGEPIFVARAEPLLYFATDTTNPTPYTGVLTVLNDEQEETILAALPDVRYVVMSDTDQPLWTYYSDELPRVQKHLERYYRIPTFFPLDDHSWIIVLERGEDRGPTLIDLVDERPRARAWLRDRSGVERPDTEPPPKLVARHNRRPLPVRLGPLGGGIDYEIEVPPNARFQAGVGYRGMVSLDNLHEHPKRSRMVVSLGRDGRFEVLHSERVSDARRAGRGWTPLDLDLSAYAGERVTLRLELVPEVPLGRCETSPGGGARASRALPRGVQVQPPERSKLSGHEPRRSSSFRPTTRRRTCRCSCPEVLGPGSATSRCWWSTTTRPTAPASSPTTSPSRTRPRPRAAPRAEAGPRAPPTAPASRRALELGADFVVQMDADFSHPPDDAPDPAAARSRATTWCWARAT